MDGQQDIAACVPRVFTRVTVNAATATPIGTMTTYTMNQFLRHRVIVVAVGPSSRIASERASRYWRTS
jgi:hypothetical protein